jgi:hypothetical protein
MTFDAYKVAVKLTLINGVSAGLAGLAGEFKGLNKHVGSTQQGLLDIEKRLHNIKRLGMIGGGMAAAGGFGLALFKAPIEEAIKLDQQISKFKLFGMGDKVNAEAVSFAKGMNVMGSSYTENMKLMIEAQGVFRESGIGGSAALEGAKLAAPLLAKIAFSTKSLDGESSAKLNTSALAMLRYVEDSGGLKSPEKFKELADAGWKMVQTSGGSVSWEQLRQFKARAGVAGMNISGDGMAELEPVITMLKGQTAGFALRTAYNRLNGIIKIPNQVAHELVNGGLWDAHKVIFNSMGGIKAFKGNPFKYSKEFNENQPEFYAKYIIPLHQKMGITTESQIAQANAMMFGSTGGTLFTLIDKNLAKLRQSLDAQNKALGIDESAKVAGDSANGKFVDLHAKWANVLAELGTAILPMAIRGVENLTNTLKSAISFAHEFPVLSKTLIVGFAGVSALFVAGGVFAMALSGFAALGLILSGGGAAGLGAAAGVGLAALLGGVATALGVLAAAAGVFYAGYKAAEWIDHKLNDPDPTAVKPLAHAMLIPRIKKIAPDLHHVIPSFLPKIPSIKPHFSIFDDGDNGSYARPSANGVHHHVHHVHLNTKIDSHDIAHHVVSKVVDSHSYSHGMSGFNQQHSPLRPGSDMVHIS